MNPPETVRTGASRRVSDGRSRASLQLDPSGEWWGVRAHYASLVIGGLVLFWIGRHHWFFADDWEFVTRRGVMGDPHLGLFVPHTQHWSTGPILIWRLLLSVFGLHSYVPFMALNVMFHLAVVHLIWRLARRGGASAWVSSALAALFMVASSNGYNAFWAFQIAFNGTIAIGLLVLLLAEHTGELQRGRKWGVAVLATVMMTFSSIAVPLLVAIGLLLAVRHGRRYVLLILPAACAFAVWFVLVGRHPIPGNDAVGIHPELSLSILGPSLMFVARGLSGAVGAPFLVGSLGSVALTVLVGWWCWTHRRDLVRASAGAAAAAVAGILFFVLAAVARSTSDADDPLQARYLYVAGALLLPLTIVALDSTVRRVAGLHRVAVPLLLALICALVLANLVELRTLARDQAIIEQTLGGRVVGAATQIREGRPYIANSAPEPQLSFDVLMSDLVVLLDQGWVPTADALQEPELGIVRLQNQIGLSSDAPLFEVGPALSIERTTGLELMATAAGCVTVTPLEADGAMLLSARSPSSLSVATDIYTEMAVRLRTPSGAPLPATRGFALPAGTTWLDIAATEHLVEILPGPTPVTICGLIPSD